MSTLVDGGELLLHRLTVLIQALPGGEQSQLVLTGSSRRSQKPVEEAETEPRAGKQHLLLLQQGLQSEGGKC